eukprot:763615-Hanusia_phi.AAC.3
MHLDQRRRAAIDLISEPELPAVVAPPGEEVPRGVQAGAMAASYARPHDHRLLPLTLSSDRPA